MSTPLVILADDVSPQVWRNGGGQTRELWTWPNGTDWQVRVSRADITRDGPFSAFDGVQRWFVVLTGLGVTLQFSDGDASLHSGDAPLTFDGAKAPTCALVDGPTLDLNLMVRGGKSLMRIVDPDPWEGGFAQRGLYTAVPGEWRDGTHTAQMAAHSLLWSHANDGTFWSFAPDTPTCPMPAWWLGFTPETCR